MQRNEWFSQDSMIRHVYQEALGLLGAGRAVLLQLAHPLVAAGVAQHSNFQYDPLSRLFHTLELFHMIVFGNQRQGNQAIERFNRIHDRIQGQLLEPVGPYPVGTTYTGHNKDLKLWVFATLIDTNLIIHEQFVTPLTQVERHQFYADAGVMAELLGVPRNIIPTTLDDFHVYMDDMLNSDRLVVSDMTRQVAHNVIYPDVGIIPTASAMLLRFVTAGTLPDRFRQAYNLHWDPKRQLLLNQLSRMTRILRPVVPTTIWQSPMLGGRLPRWLLWQVAKMDTAASEASDMI